EDEDDEGEPPVDFEDIEFYRTVGLATVTIDYVTGRIDHHTARVSSDHIYSELSDMFNPQLLRDGRTSRIYLKTVKHIEENDLQESQQNPYANGMKPGYHIHLTEVLPVNGGDSYKLGRTHLVGPEVTQSAQLNWFNKGAAYFRNGKFNLLSRLDKKSLSSKQNVAPDNKSYPFIPLNSATVRSNLQSILAPLGAIRIDPVEHVRMQGPLIEVPNALNTGHLGSRVKRYLGVGQLSVPYYERYFWVRGIVCEYWKERIETFCPDDLDNRSDRIDEALTDCRMNFRNFWARARRHLAEIGDSRITGFYPESLKIWGAEFDKEHVDERIVYELQNYVTNGFSEFVLKLIHCPPHDHTVKRTNRETPFNAFSDGGGIHIPGLGAAEIAMPPDNLNMIFLYDILKAEGGENEVLPDFDSQFFRVSDAFLFKDRANMDPDAIAYNMAPVEGGYLMGYGASEASAKVAMFNDYEIEHLLSRGGNPLRTMRFRFL
ncbi:MAG: hypothetical protein MI743_13690, partial [Sneathiellales bacterium]|nr:hypothetical protein [Sneathiellales bacterium]